MLLFLVSLFYARRRRGVSSRLGTALGAGLLAFQTAALALATNVWLYMLSVIIGGLGSGILLTAQYNYNLENVPDHERPAWLSWNLLLGNAAILIGAVTGPALALATGAPGALWVAGVLRLIIGLVIFRWG